VAPENVEIVRQSLEAAIAFRRGEASSEAVAEFLDPQVEVHWRDKRTYPDTPQQLRGVQETIRFAERFQAAWADVVEEPLEQFIEAPGGRVLAPLSLSGRGRESGVPIVVHFFALWTIRDGKVRRIEYFRHRDDALEAAGLEE
jgi:ketosteroid isomerase-like protein